MASIDDIRKVYEQHDDDKNGVLTFQEAQSALQALGNLARNPSSFEDDFNRLSKNGVIGFDEFKQLANLTA
uniref:EF-hand domain-containing protein n=1 Tax=Panagrellus redivivus TaxID=6233 RepID=A0A7E4UL92_PANRE